MNYNDYDSRGNKKKINLSDMFFDKQKRSIVILCFYLLIFIVLIVFLRISFKSNKEVINNEDDKKIVEEKDDKPVVNDKFDEMFSFIDMNNYNFKIVLTYNDGDFISVGKRFKDKFFLSVSKDEMYREFYGVFSNLKTKNDDGSEVSSEFPYVLINYYDNDVIKSIIRASNYNNGKYEISNGLLYEVLGRKLNDDSKKDELSILELVMKNNNVVGVNIDFTNAIRVLESNVSVAKVSIEYTDFGLVDDFSF